MSLISPQTYQKYVMIENGQKVLYVKIQKALFGMLKSALLFYKKLRAHLESCCKQNNGKQKTIIWHVNDMKISHCDGREITKIIKWLGKIYGDIEVKHGKKHHCFPA